MRCFRTTSILAPARKKGIYGVLLAIGENEEWLTLHASTVQVVTPYDNITTIMHEGASGSGKSEMLEYVHRQEDGRLLLGRNLITGEERRLVLNQACSSVSSNGRHGDVSPGRAERVRLSAGL